jgi:hypothetical protein
LAEEKMDDCWLKTKSDTMTDGERIGEEGERESEVANMRW